MPSALKPLFVSSFVVALCLFSFSSAWAESLKVAVASNFMAPMKIMETAFEKESGVALDVSFASSGKFYAQILHGAPYAVFLSADDDKPSRLVEKGFAEASTEFTYALGSLALVANKSIAKLDNNSLRDGEFAKLAIANPKLAPYGKAAIEVMEAQAVAPKYQSRLILGENVTQTFQFVFSGNVDAAFVAYSQVLQAPKDQLGGVWKIPPNLHQPIKQNAVLLSRAKSNEAALAFLDFLKSKKAEEIMASFGYGTVLN